MKIYCCNCQGEVDVRLTKGKEIYPNRRDLANIPFWIHDECKGFVGCHHKTDCPTAPLGYIPTQAIKVYRKRLHGAIDPFWENHPNKRKARVYLYKDVSNFIGYQYHAAKIKTEAEAAKILKYVTDDRTKQKWLKELKNLK